MPVNDLRAKMTFSTTGNADVDKKRDGRTQWIRPLHGNSATVAAACTILFRNLIVHALSLDTNTHTTTLIHLGSGTTRLMPICTGIYSLDTESRGRR